MVTFLQEITYYHRSLGYISTTISAAICRI